VSGERELVPGSEPHVRLWDAINAYAESCGGDTSTRTVSSRRMDAVVAVERALREALEGPHAR
jgi:hypothetical protein